MPHRPLWLLAPLLLRLWLPGTAMAQDVNLVWTSTAAASGGGISATAVTVGAASIDLLNATNPTFVAEYGSSYSALSFLAPAGLPGDTDSTITFSPALPAGARLVVVDVDFRGETMTLTSGGVPLTFLAQLESILGASSVFPGWAPPTLVASGPPTTNNDLEATVFDLSGVTTLEVSFDEGLGSGVSIAVFVPPLPVPMTESAGLIVLLVMLIGLGMALWRQRVTIV